MELELISFKLCPFAQRAMISLEVQKIDFKMTYINPMDPPDWFKETSPTGQVPLLICSIFLPLRFCASGVVKVKLSSLGNCF
jgi:glutathione S-transferase